MKCPHCNENIDVRLIKAPSNSQGSLEGADISGLEAILDRIHEDELEHQNEIDFVKQTRERFEQYGERTRMSEKQMTWLRKIAAR
jgi:hypothetical protein